MANGPPPYILRMGDMARVASHGFPSISCPAPTRCCIACRRSQYHSRMAAWAQNSKLCMFINSLALFMIIIFEKKSKFCFFTFFQWNRVQECSKTIFREKWIRWDIFSWFFTVKKNFTKNHDFSSSSSSSNCVCSCRSVHVSTYAYIAM